jgi:hypothetical protein
VTQNYFNSELTLGQDVVETMSEIFENMDRDSYRFVVDETAGPNVTFSLMALSFNRSFCFLVNATFIYSLTSLETAHAITEFSTLLHSCIPILLI